MPVSAPVQAGFYKYVHSALITYMSTLYACRQMGGVFVYTALCVCALGMKGLFAFQGV